MALAKRMANCNGYIGKRNDAYTQLYAYDDVADHEMIGAFGFYTKLAIQLGFALVAVALLWPAMLSYLIKQEMQLSPGSKSFQHWKETPVPMYIDVYFHNWENPYDILTEKPVFTQMGPYRFYEKRTKVDITWNDNGTVSYRQTRHWFFDPEHSNGTLQDQVTNINMVPLGLAHVSRFKTESERRSLSYALTLMNQKLWMTKTVEELLFEGYQDSILTLMNHMPSFITGGVQVADKFGWFYERNGSRSIDGIFNMDTGANDIKQVGHIRSWNYENTTGYFKDRCGNVDGTSGEVFPPYLSKEDTIGLFSGDLCRTIYLSNGQETLVDGVKGLRYVGGTDLVDSGVVDPNTACFQEGEPVPLGLLNITTCRLGLPVFISYPHFYHGTEELVNSVEGMEPEKEKHEFSITVEPTYGVPIDVKARFQVNLMVEPSEDILLYSDVPERYFMPILWFDQRARLTPVLADEVKTMVAIYTITTSLAFCLLIIGTVLAAAGITSACRRFQKNAVTSASSPCPCGPSVIAKIDV